MNANSAIIGTASISRASFSAEYRSCCGPKVIFSTLRRMYTAARMTPSAAIAVTHFIVSNRPRKLRNSPMKPDRPGSPRDAIPAASSMPLMNGIGRARPPSSSSSVVPVRSYRLPTIRNSSAEMRPCDTSWNTAPCRPISFSDAIPSSTMPIWLTDE